MHNIKSQTAPKIFPSKFPKTTLQIFITSILYIMPPLKLRISEYRMLNFLNTEFQSEALHYRRKFQKTLRKCKKIYPFLKIL